MITLFLVRHGETVDNIEGRIQGQLDSPLTELGIRQSEAAAERLAAESLVAVYSSDLGRARTTAEIIAARHGLPVVTTELLREANFGQVQGWTSAQFAERLPVEYARWRSDSSAYRPPDGETVARMVARCGKFAADIAARHADGDQIVVVGHGGSIKALIIATCGLPERLFSRIHTANASVSIVHLAQRSSLWMLNDTCHLDSLRSVAPDADNPQ